MTAGTMRVMMPLFYLAVVLLLASLTLVGVGVAALTRGVQILNPEALQATSNAP